MAFFDLSDEFYMRVYEEGKPEGNSIDDKTMVFILELLTHAEYDKIAFYDREDRWSVIEFLQWAKSGDKLFCILYKKDATPIAVVWFNGISSTGRQAFAHFSTLKTAPPDECMRAGRLLLQTVARVTKMKQFIGITPMCYRHALRYSEGLGFKPLTVLKRYCRLRGKERDVRLSICGPNGENDGVRN